MTKKTTSTNQTDEMEEDATTGMINIWKNLNFLNLNLLPFV